MADEKPAAEAPAAEGGKKKLALLENKVVLLGVIVIVQALLAIGITQFVIMPKIAAVQAAGMGPQTSAIAAEPEMGIIVGLQEIIVTLQSDPGRASYLRINVNLEVADQVTAEKVTARLPQLRDIVIMTLSSKRSEDLSSPEGKQATRSEIFRRLAEKLPAESLRNIYFSDLVIQ